MISIFQLFWIIPLAGLLSAALVIVCVAHAAVRRALRSRRCKTCQWFGKPGCAIEIVDDSDKPRADDYCSFWEEKDESKIDAD